jgi:hypothetical protein
MIFIRVDNILKNSVIIAITLVPFVFYRGELIERTKLHEKIHFRQYLELFVIGLIPLYFIFENSWWMLLSHFSFYLLYIIEFLIRILFTFNRKKAYSTLSFERECYRNKKKDYLKKRIPFSWIKYIFK